jgi:hypothetical protein
VGFKSGAWRGGLVPSFMIAFVLVTAACDNTPTSGPLSPGALASAKVQDDAVQAAKIAEAQEKAQEKAQVVANPTAFLETSNEAIFDKGIINTYRQLSKVTVLNKSHFALRNIQGSVDWLDESGNTLGSTAVTLAGSIPAGDTKSFSTEDHSMSSTTLQGKAAKYLLKFTHVDIID